MAEDDKPWFDVERFHTDKDYRREVQTENKKRRQQAPLRFDLAAEIGARIYNSAEPVPVDPDRFAAVVAAALKAYRSGVNL